jgi:hypothetical protein
MAQAQKWTIFWFDFISLILLSVLLIMMEKGFDSKYHEHLVLIEWLSLVYLQLNTYYVYHKHTKPYIFSFMA